MIFVTYTKFVVLNMKHNVILNQDFWTEFCLQPDYVSFEVYVYD